jgi:hypothetical protein
MVRCVFSLVLALQLLLPAHALQALLAAATPAPAAEPVPTAAPKVCPCTGKVGCKCCGCGDEPEPETPADKPAPSADTGMHCCVKCSCKIAESMAASNVYVANRKLMLRTLCQPQQEWLPARSERWSSPVLPIDSPPPKSIA